MADALFGLAALFICLIVYFLPTIIARNKNKKQTVAIFVLNLLLGGTGIGWVVALIWAVSND